MSPHDWRLAQKNLPIACVDVLPIAADDRATRRVGLILRETPHEGRRWCLVGGRLLRDETLHEGIARQLRETLGDAIRFTIEPQLQPTYVAEYFPEPRPHSGVDPRQHAVGLTYCVRIRGTVHPQGEALDFHWFKPDDLPDPDQFGFNQDRLVAACLARINGEFDCGRKDTHQ